MEIIRSIDYENKDKLNMLLCGIRLAIALNELRRRRTCGANSPSGGHHKPYSLLHFG
jgi:hypothetical protein